MSDVLRAFAVRRVSFFRPLLALIVFLGIMAGASPRLFAYPVPAVTQMPNWMEPSQSGGPSARYGAAMAYDAATGQVVLFGGYTGSSRLNDTWTWDGSTWTQQNPANSPPARYFAMMAYDAASSQLVLFGGYGASDGLDDTWTWDGSNWTQQSPATSPSTRYLAGMAYDPASSQIVLFGGNSNGNLVGDTWTWNGSTWTQQSPAASPSARQQVAMAFDVATNSMVLFGGNYGPSDLNDTWLWNGTTWTQLVLATSPSARQAAAMTYDAATSQLVLFGGTDEITNLNDTWTWNGSTVAQQSPPTSPPARKFAAMAYDAASSQVVLFGGDGEGALHDTWTWQINPVIMGSVNVCPSGATTPSPCSQSGTLQFSIAEGTTIGSINIVTQGATTNASGTPLDFTATSPDSSSTLCTPQTYSSATTCTVDVTFAPQYAGERNGAVVIEDGSGNVLATAYLVGTGNAPQVAFTPGTINTVAGNGTKGYSSDNIAATSAELDYPYDVAVDSAENLYIADYLNQRIRKVNAATGIITTVAGSGTEGYSGDGGAATSAELAYPYGVAVDGAGNLYIADFYNSRIRKVNAATGIITTVAGSGTEGYSGDGGAATSAKLYYPYGVAVDSAGNLYIADTHNNVIREVNAATGIITTVAGTGAQGYGGDGGAATSAELNSPERVAVDSAGNLYIADTENDVVREVNAATGIITTFAGTGTVGLSGDGGAAASAELAYPLGLSLDSAGNLYIADEGNCTIRKVNAATGIITTVAGTPEVAGYSGDGFAATSANLYQPYGVALDGAGNIYIADGHNNRIRQVAVSSVPTLGFATSTNVGSTDTTDGPQTVTVSNTGNEPLTFTTLTSGSNPSYPAGFLENSSDTNTLCSTSATLAVGATCDVSANFQPTGVGSNTGSVMLMDNALNTLTSGVGSATQSISFSGTGLQAGDTTTTTTSASSSSLIYSQQETVTATVLDTTNASSIPTGAVTFTDTVGGNSTTLGTVSLVNGIAMYPYTPTAGAHTVTSSYTPATSSNFAASNDTTGASFTVAAYGALNSFNAALAQTTIYTGLADTLTITPLDAEGNVVTNFSGPLTLTSSDTSATFSSVSYTNGVGTETVTFATAGTQSVTATAGAASGSVQNVTVNADPGFVVTVLTDTTTGVATNCTNQNNPGATPDANCSLRDAVAAATAVQTSYPGVPETVTFGSITQPGTITLANGALTLPSNTTVQGATSGTGLSLANLITVNGNQTSQVFAVNSGTTGAILKNLTITNGDGSIGGGVENGGTLAIVQCSIISNVSGYSAGGGINNFGTLTVQSSTISGNTAREGGGIYNTGTMSLSSDTIVNNSATDAGGGVYDTNASTMANLTVSGNSAGTGGGIYETSTSNPTVNNSIIAGNTALASADMGYNNESTTISGSGNVVGTTTSLSALGNYGGPTQTMLPLPSSAAICAGVAPSPAPASDQRGAGATTTYSSRTCMDAGAVNTNYSVQFVQQPTNTQMTLAITPAPTVSVMENGSALPISGIPVTISAAAGTLGGTALQSTDATGLTTFNNLTFSALENGDTLTAALTVLPSTPGSEICIEWNPLPPYGCIAWEPGMPIPGVNVTATSNTFNVVPQVTAFTITGYPATVAAGTQTSYTVTAYNGANIATNYTGTVTFTMSDGNGEFGNSSYTFTSADAGVQVFLSNAYFTTAGTQTITVTDSSANVTATSGNITVTAGTAADLQIVSGNSQNAVIGATFANPLLVKATDIWGNPVSGLTVNYSSGSTGAGATFSSSGSVSTGSDGTASVMATANADTGAYLVTATAPSITAPPPPTVRRLVVHPEYAASGHVSFALTNTQATPTVALTATPAGPIVYGQAKTALSASVSYTTGTPTGQLAFMNGATTLSSATLSAGATTLPAQYETPGTYQLQASYAGDSNYVAASSTVTTYVVIKATSALSGPATQPVQVVYGQTGSIPVTVAGQYSGAGIATPSSTISYSVSGSGFASGTAAVSNGAAIIPVPNTVAPGTYTVTVSYGGDTNYNAATSTQISLQVGQIQPAISWTQFSAITYGTSLAGVLNATAAYGSNPVAGTYSYLNGATAVSASTVLPAGNYSLTVNFTPTDTTTYKTATGNIALVVNQAGVSGIVLTSTVNPVLVTNTTTLAATVSSPVSTPTGSVSFFDGSSSTPLGTATLSGGIAQLPVSTLAVGMHSITAVYSGDANFLGATSTALSEQVQDFNLTISNSGGSGTPSATVTPGGTANYSFTLTPTGMSTFPSAVTLSVSGLPTGATYTINPSTIAAGAGATNISLTVSLPSQTASLQRSAPFGKGLLPLALSMLLLPFSRRMRRTASKLGRMTALLLLLMAGAAGIAGLTGCGSSTGYFAQPQQTYNVIVTATSGALTHSTTVTLTVQ